MTEKRWNLIRRLHSAALELAEAKREEFLRAQCGEDIGVLNEVMGLLQDDADDDFLSSPPAEEGVTLGDFELRAEVGSGGTGIVYRAWQNSLSREVAIKLLPRHFALNAERVERFHREARAAAKLQHPSIAPIFEVGCEGDSHFIAMELVDGLDLAGELLAVGEGTSTRFPKAHSPEYFRAIAKVVQAIAEALAYSHDMGVIHRDVKPHNILIDDSSTPKLVDFGLARDESLGSITVTNRVEGTPFYMSPEQARSTKGEVDARTDIYSLGAVLYELCTLCRPYEGRTSREIIDKIIVREPKAVRSVNPKVPLDLAIICAKAMEREVNDRYSKATELAEDLKRFLADQPILAKPPSLVRRTRRFTSHHRVAVSAACGLAVTLFASRAAYGWAEKLHWMDVQLDAGPAAVRAYPMDVSGAEVVGEPVDLGRTPLDTKVPPGLWLLQLESNTGELAEAMFNLHAGQRIYSKAVTLRSPEEIHRGMARIEPRIWDTTGVCKQLPDSLELHTFFVDKNEVTVDEYRAFCDATSHPYPAFWAMVDTSRLPGNFPVTGIGVEDAEAYASWKGKRLLTHAEYEYLLHGPDNTEFCWGDAEPTAEHRRAPGPHISEGAPIEERFEHLLEYAAPVGSYKLGATPDGVLDIIGGAAEYLGTAAVEFSGDELVAMPEWKIEVANGFVGNPEGISANFTHVLRPGGNNWYPIHMGFRCASTAGEL